MKKKLIVLMIALNFMLAGCEKNIESDSLDESTIEDNSFDESAIQNEIISNILACEFSPAEIEYVLLTSSDKNMHCSISSSWAETTSTFLTECYYMIPIVKEIMNTYGCNCSEINISSLNPNISGKMRRLSYLSDSNITLLDSSGDNILTETYNYEQLNEKGTTVVSVEYDTYSDEYVSFEYDKNLFTVNPSDDKLTLAIKCPTIPKEPEGTHNTILGITTQENQYFSEISENDVREILETISKTTCQGLFKLNEGESVVSEDTKYSDFCAEYTMKINDGSQCYVKTINYNTYITTVVLRICDYSKDYNDAFMDIYNSSRSELGNYDFNTQHTDVETPLPAEKTVTPAKDSSIPTELLVDPIDNSSGIDSSSSITASSGKGSSNIDTLTDTATNNTTQSTTDHSLTENGNTDNFNTYDNVEQQQTEASYVLNTNTMKIHFPSCGSVKKIAPQNYSTSNSSVEELKAQGYSTCGICFK